MTGSAQNRDLVPFHFSPDSKRRRGYYPHSGLVLVISADNYFTPGRGAKYCDGMYV